MYVPLVVGGGDEQKTYRSDSFICAAAVHAYVSLFASTVRIRYLRALAEVSSPTHGEDAQLSIW